MRMHDDEVNIDIDIVRKLIAAQFPEHADFPISPIRSTGTVNAIYRLGDELCVRLPRVHQWATDLQKEWKWLPRLAPHLTVRVPKPVALGEPVGSYPLPWGIYQWIDGEPYTDELIDNECDAAKDLAEFVMELRSVDPEASAPRGGRRPLKALDDATREAIWASQDVIDADAAVAAWDAARKAPTWDGKSVWIHADLLRPNLLVKEGRLFAVIDFGGVGIGDPASDIIPAWSVFGSRGREVFRQVLDVDDGTWNRARGIALHQAALIIPYYRATNPGFVTLAKRTIGEIIAEMLGEGRGL